jgi:hypothetical protein
VSELPEIRASDAERDQAVARLRDAAGEGRLTLDEFTQRMERAYESRTRVELDELTRDLPSPRSREAPLPAPRTRRWVIALMGNAARRGRWRAGERTNAITVMGNSTIDLRDAVLSSPEIEIVVLCLMGNTHVLVPDGVDVDVGAFALMGNKFDRTRGLPRPGAPVVRIEGLVMMGNLTVRSSSRSRADLPLPPAPPAPPALPG